MKNKNKKILITGILLSIFSICFVTSYAFFNFTKVTNEEVINTGTIYMKLDSEENNITLTNAFPETQESADLKTNNYIDFTVKGLNTYEDSIYYEIDVINGSVPTDYTEDNRIDPSNIMLELTDLDTNTVISVTEYSDLDSNKIYVKTIKSTTELEHKYRLRVWIDEDVLISDTDPNKTYCASNECDDSTKKIYSELFASVKVKVYGDLVEKHLYNVMGTLDSFSSYKSNIKEIYFLNESQDLINDGYNAATIKYNITNTSHSEGTTELRNMNDYGKVLAWLEPIDETYYTLYIASNGYTYLSTGYRLFSDFSNLTTIDLSNVKTNFVTDMQYMFYNSRGITSLDVSNFNTSNVTTMYWMFHSCSSLTSLDVSNFKTSNVSNIAYMFAGCSSLTSLDVSNFNTSKVTNMEWMFRGCSSLTSLDLSKFDTSKLTSMECMFSSCTSLTSLDLSNFDTSNITNMYLMFSGCSSLTSLDLSNFDTSNVTRMSYMFYNCSKLTTIYVGDYWSTASVTSSTDMFKNCSKLVGGAGTTYNSSYVDATYAHVDEGTTNPGYLTLKV